MTCLKQFIGSSVKMKRKSKSAMQKEMNLLQYFDQISPRFDHVTIHDRHKKSNKTGINLSLTSCGFNRSNLRPDIPVACLGSFLAHHS